MHILKGKPAADKLMEHLAARRAALAQKEISPKLCLLRVGNRQDDVTYEKNILKKAAALDILTEVIELPESISQEELIAHITRLNSDAAVHGILVFFPLPKHIDGRAVADTIDPAKDIDGASRAALASLFIGENNYHTPATPDAVLRLLDYYDIDVDGKRVCIVGRSLVVGKPLAMLLQARGATITTIHTHTNEPKELTRAADIIVVCAGVMRYLTRDFVKAGQIVIDVGIHYDAVLQKLQGDVDFEGIQDIAYAASPVPGGVGALTTACLMDHLLTAAEKSIQ